MTPPLRVALVQANATVGDCDGNAKLLRHFLDEARRLKAQLVLFPELFVTGYPPEDILFQPSFIEKNLATVRKLASFTKGLTAVVGFVDRGLGGKLYNAAAILSHGKWIGRYQKMFLPNYGVFDEERYFTPGKKPLLLQMGQGETSLSAGVSICEDMWVEKGPAQAEAAAGARLLVNISASPYHAGKIHEREKLLFRRAKTLKSWISYVNLVGGQDELVFDGGSLLADPSGKIVFRAPQFREGIFLVEIPVAGGAPVSRQPRHIPVLQLPWKPEKFIGKASRSSMSLAPEEEIFQALILGTRDYVRKNGFQRVVIGLSGGIDSALAAAIAVAALGKEKVTGVSMPSRFSSLETQSDARAVARNLQMEFLEIPIETVFQAFLKTLEPAFGDRPADVTEENLQARIRGVLLMALSNKFGWLVLATGNKSELSTGYCTLYGDMVGGFAVIKDLPKTLVYRISRCANRFFGRSVIPESVFKRPPTAELAPNQKDEDTLPPYARLDPIVKAYVEEEWTAAQIQKRLKSTRQEVLWVLRRIDANEYKRRQAPLGIKITPRAFGKDRRMPITNRYTQEVKS